MYNKKMETNETKFSDYIVGIPGDKENTSWMKGPADFPQMLPSK